MHVHLIVSGHVQGVGFRFTAQQKANKYNLLGWVKNNPDGTVELEVEGPEENINLFINELEKGFNRFIQVKHVKQTTSNDEKGYKQFKIKH